MVFSVRSLRRQEAYGLTFILLLITTHPRGLQRTREGWTSRPTQHLVSLVTLLDHLIILITTLFAKNLSKT